MAHMSKGISRDMTEQLNRIVDGLVMECLQEALQAEDRVVKFNDAQGGGKPSVYPNFGQAVIMAGSSGSGKGYVINNILPINAKRFDVDRLKELYIKAQEKEGTKIGEQDPTRYDLKNPEDVSTLHFKVKSKGFNYKQKDNFFDDTSKDPRRLPNVIFDITGKSEGDIIDAALMCREIGYEQVTLVWVVTNRSRAIWNNLSRERSVSQFVLHTIHNQVNELLPNFIKDKGGDYLDNVWIVFNSTDTLRAMNADEKKQVAVSLKKENGRFVMSKEDEERLAKILGDNEPNPSDPQKYRTFDDIKNDPDFNKWNHKYQGDTTFKK